VKILFLVPPVTQEKATSKYQLAFLNFTAPPLGLGYIAAVLEENGYSNIKILDSQALNLTQNEYRKFLKRYNPDFLGIQTLTPNFKDAISAAHIAKDENARSFLYPNLNDKSFNIAYPKTTSIMITNKYADHLYIYVGDIWLQKIFQ